MSQSRILLVLLIIQHVNRRRFSVGYIYLLSRPSPAFRTTALPLILLRPFLPYTFTNRREPFATIPSRSGGGDASSAGP